MLKTRKNYNKTKIPNHKESGFQFVFRMPLLWTVRFKFYIISHIQFRELQ